jgi:hypothetical protein
VPFGAEVDTGTLEVAQGISPAQAGNVSTLFSFIRKEEPIMATCAPNQLYLVPLAELLETSTEN